MRDGTLRILVWLAVIGGVVALARIEPTPLAARWRWFMPGSLGRELRDTPLPPAAQGYRSRVFHGLSDAEAAQWGRRNGLTAPVHFSHHLGTIIPPWLRSVKPEFFPLEAGQRIEPRPGVFYWNPDIARPDVAHYAAERAREHFDAHPRETTFSLGINDALLWGESPELLQLATPTRWFRHRPDYAAVVGTFMNRAAAELARTHPDKYLGSLAYYWCENAPAFPLHPQVLPFLTADRSQGYDRTFWAEELALQERWSEVAPPTRAGEAPRRIGLYDYIYGAGFLIPRQHPMYLAESLRHAFRLGFTDYFAEVSPNWGLDGPQPWLVAQLLQDPAQPAEALLDEYYRSYFRESAAPMRRFFARCAERWAGQPGPAYWLKHYRNESQATLFPSAVCRELRALLRDAEAQAVSPTVAARVRFVGAAFGATERFVAFCEARDRLARAVLAGRAGPPALLEGLAAMVEARDEVQRYVADLRAREPLALAPFDWTDFLRNDPTAATLRLVRRAGVDRLPARLASPDLAALWTALDRTEAAERLRNPALAGPVRPGRTVAGLTYGVALPAEWYGRVEPFERHRAELRGPAEARTLRIEETFDTAVQQWATIGDDRWHRAQVRLRGRVSTSGSVALVIGWLDAQHRHLGTRTLRLPEGEWPEWVELVQAAERPPEAVLVGLAVRVQYQLPGDWIEAGGFSLTALR